MQTLDDPHAVLPTEDEHNNGFQDCRGIWQSLASTASDTQVNSC